MDTHTLLHLLAGALILVGLLGTVLPVLPGVPVLFAGMWLAAWNDGYTRVGVATLVVLGLLVLVSLAIDVFASLIGARRVGASNKALWGAAIGGLLGAFFGFAGLLLGPFFGAMGGELAHGGGHGAALRVGAGTWVGIAVGTVLKVMVAGAMLALFAGALLID